MTDQSLADELAARVLGWRAAPDRYIRSGRSWIPRWRFRPCQDIKDAFTLLERAADSFSLKGDSKIFTAEVCVRGRLGKATGEPRARTITTAIARALGLEV